MINHLAKNSLPQHPQLMQGECSNVLVLTRWNIIDQVSEAQLLNRHPPTQALALHVV
jgi:hypothetical protein